MHVSSSVTQEEWLQSYPTPVRGDPVHTTAGDLLTWLLTLWFLLRASAVIKHLHLIISHHVALHLAVLTANPTKLVALGRGKASK